MRKLVFALILGLSLSATVGCIVPIFSGDPKTRTRQLLFSSENMRAILQEWERIWFLDMPDHMTPNRVHGGVI